MFHALAIMVAVMQAPTTISQDDLFAHFIGKWHIIREFPKRKAENDSEVEFVLDGHWLRISMNDVNRPSKYEAHVYITRMQDAQTYSIHWLDTYGGTGPDALGTGKRDGNSVVFDFKDTDGSLRNTFTWHADRNAWTSKIEQTDEKGVWTLFCTDTYTKKG